MDKPLLIASDVDGTLLTPLEKLSERTAAVVRRTVESGVPFVLVSGRPPRWIPPVAGKAGLTGYAVCANGAVIYDVGADRVLSVHGLEPVQLHDLADAMSHALPQASLATERVVTTDEQHPPPQYVSESDFRNPWGDGDSLHASRAEVLGRTAIKMLVSDPRMTSDAMAEAAHTVLDGAFAVTFSTGAGLIEISASSITKATGLAEVARRLDVPHERVIAFGDMPNDVQMLRWAGHGVAMANAHPAVLGAADEVTASNAEDGVAQVLERWF
ncbi:MAG: HAD family hydrolase [Thermocrispum sp.]